MRKKQGFILVLFVLICTGTQLWADNEPGIPGRLQWDSGGAYYFSGADLELGEVQLSNASQAYISGSEMGRLETFDTSTAVISGGDLFELWIFDNSIINFAGGDLKVLWASENSKITFHGIVDSFVYTPNAGNYDSGLLTGILDDSTNIRVNLFSNDTFSHIEIIPEPATITLFLIGGAGILLRNKRK